MFWAEGNSPMGEPYKLGESLVVPYLAYGSFTSSSYRLY